ncbi:MAG: Eco57I restriction-modification methylase domain-containing protein [Anaerolineae bacterium]|nr:Eco57I restriction-modification methylase domain-containing protein [Anaerolineae bacterium]
MEKAGLYQVNSLSGVDATAGPVEQADLYRADACFGLDSEHRASMGQFFTPPTVARFMASLFTDPGQEIHLLDAGAGVGTLTAAFVEDTCERDVQPRSLSVKAYELEPLLVEYLHATLTECQEACAACGIEFKSKVLEQDFILAGVDMLRGGLFPVERYSFNRAILNPPYRKIRSDSEHRHLLSSIGLEISNLYAAFLAIAADLIEPGGEMVAITPRSFCNGPYFKPFRKIFLGAMALRRIHVFESREEAFKDDDVLQENIIFHAVKDGNRGKVLISTSDGPAKEGMTVREVDYAQVIPPDDLDVVIHIAASEMDQFVLDRISVFKYSLDDLGIAVSTGRVVDFRARNFLKHEPAEDTVPLIYPTHFDEGFVRWPKPGSRKPNAIVLTSQTKSLLLPAGDYVLVKRFSSKEEPRRVVAALFDPAHISSTWVGFENHLNVYHRDNAGLPKELARGLAVFLNSTLVDSYFRQFNGHTQVNATDLRMLRYPSREILEALGSSIQDSFPSRREIDDLLEREIHKMADIQSPNPVAAKEKIEETVEILKALDFPRGQQNERSALTLLALLDLKPEMPWSKASDPLMGITPIMDFCRDYYGRQYAPNTRETFRRHTVHQFVEAGLAVPNPDDPGRAVNSPRFCYQIEPAALELLRAYGTRAWENKLKGYLRSAETLRQRYARARQLKMVPVTLAEGHEFYLTPGEHSRLTKAILDEFAPRFVPGGHVVYVGDTGGKWRYFDEDALHALGVTVDVHGKMPDVVIHHVDKDWLVLVEAVTSHGPVNPKRREELRTLFKDARPALVYVTAFLTRSDMARYASEISWETDVWVQEAGTHLIHFDGERFLGPYDSQTGQAE